ncbi:hypothetical protein [Asticcacaulis taihuensis]|uniref:hypothetical protein n=1 Tax=Asticcacaulis taihuensis TaxID=260084 RepID=UPI0026EC0BC1|nr:hypothetical protein [Asticcacaulis taihuensis]
MKTTIGTFNSATRSVSVTFEHNGVTHTRDVNACLTDKGHYDKKATAARVQEVANGVTHKIESGAITNPPEPEAEPEAEPASVESEAGNA